MTNKTTFILLAIVTIITVLWLASEPIAEAVGLMAKPFAISLFLFGVLFAAILCAGLGAKLYDRTQNRTLDRRERKAQIRLLETEAEERAVEIDKQRRRLDLEVITAAPGQQIIVGDLAKKDWHNKTLDPRPYSNGYDTYRPPEAVELLVWERWHQLNGTARRPQPGQGTAPLIEGPAALPNIIEIMPRLDRQILTGGTGSGKTNTLKHFVSHLVTHGKSVAVVDPHSPSKLVGLDVIGANLNFEEIADFFVETMAKISYRYETGRIAQDGNLGDLNTYLIIEEFYDIHSQLRDLAADFLKCLLVRGRKAGYKFILVTQNDSVQALGIKGDGGLLLGAERVELKRDVTTGERRAIVGRRVADQVECAVPGKFTDYPMIPPGQLVIDRPRNYTETERAIIRAIVDNPGASKAEIYRAAGVSKNGPNSRFIDDFLAKMGVQ